MTAAVAAPTGSPAGTQADPTQANTDYMARSRRYPIRMPLVGGNLNGPYATGSTLNFIAGPVNNGWLDTIELDVNLTITMTTATATVNAAFPWNLIQYITVNLDGQISYIEPYFASFLLPRLRGYERTPVTQVLAGIANADVSNTLYNVPATTLAVGANTVRFRVRFPLNALHALDGSGLLPTQGTQDPVQINVVLPSTLIGPDPFNHPATSATGTAAVTGTITCYGWVRDGRTPWSPGEVLPFYPDGLPQVSYDIEPNLINLVAGSIVRGQLTKVMKVYYGVACIIDGNQSNQFAVNTNINSWDLSADSSGGFKLKQFGLENIQTDLLWSDLRQTFGQDFPEGIIPFEYAPQSHSWDPDMGGGTDVLNMVQGGWTSLYQGINLAAINGLGTVQPRIHTWVLGTSDSPYIG